MIGMIKKSLPQKSKKRLIGHVDKFSDGVIYGWIDKSILRHGDKYKIYLNDEMLGDVLTEFQRPDLSSIGIQKNNDYGFSVKCDFYPYLDPEKKNYLEVKLDVSAPPLPGEKIKLALPDIRYHIDRIDAEYIHGWVLDKNHASLSLSVDVYSKDKFVASFSASQNRVDLLSAGFTNSNCGFSWRYADVLDSNSFNEIDLYIAKSKIKINTTPIVIENNGAKLSCLNLLAQRIRNNQTDFSNEKKGWLINDVLPAIAKSIRSENSFTYTANKTSTPAKSPASVNVIIPVYDGYDETIECINSVVNAQNTIVYNLIVIDDCSPCKELSRKLVELSHTLKFELHINETNRGFVKTVNRGMKLNTDNDVVLLNADTIVPDGWLDQLVDVAYESCLNGTVTPMSNNATICSYPEFCVENTLEQDKDVNYYNKLLKSANGNSSIDLPTAHGFCMFIKREVINEVGFFDEKKWGMGYGEENDFSLRAQQAGWKNVASVGTYVQHVGSVSFAESSSEFIQINLKKLNGIYPEYAANVNSFIVNDPLREYRNKAAMIELRGLSSDDHISGAGDNFLFISLTIGGGTTVATDSLQDLLELNSVSSYYLTSPYKNIWRVSNRKCSSFADFDVNSEEEYVSFIKFLKDLNITNLQYHHVIQFDSLVKDLPELLNIPYDITLHDYYYICPRVNLIDDTGEYCGEPPEESCNKCISLNGFHDAVNKNTVPESFDISRWRESSLEFMSRAKNIYAPSHDTADRFKSYFHELEVKVRYHPEPIRFVESRKQSGANIHVAILGAIGQHKGFHKLVAAIKYAEKFKLPIEFHIIGYTQDDTLVSKFSNVVVHGKYDRASLPDRIKTIGCSVSLLLSVWPETFSYTYSESIFNGLSVVALNHGAIPERAKDDALIISPSSTGKEICDAIMNTQSMRWKREIGIEYPNPLQTYFNY